MPKVKLHGATSHVASRKVQDAKLITAAGFPCWRRHTTQPFVRGQPRRCLPFGSAGGVTFSNDKKNKHRWWDVRIGFLNAETQRRSDSAMVLRAKLELRRQGRAQAGAWARGGAEVPSSLRLRPPPKRRGSGVVGCRRIRSPEDTSNHQHLNRHLGPSGCLRQAISFHSVRSARVPKTRA